MLHFGVLRNIFGVLTIVYSATQVYSQTCGRPIFSNTRIDHRGDPAFSRCVNATEGEWPWMGAIMRKERSGKSLWCSGFLIDRRHVLSAAHCIDRNESNVFTVRIGRINRKEAKEYSVSKIALPERYKVGSYNEDIVVLTLSREVDEPNFVPICLPDTELSNIDLTGYGTAIAGWGGEDDKLGKNRIDDSFLKTMNGIPIVSTEECTEIFRRVVTGNVFKRQFPRGLADKLCAGFTESGRQGDECAYLSGAPLMLRNGDQWFAVGLISFGVSRGLPGIPVGYTRVTSYLNWIRENSRD